MIEPFKVYALADRRQRRSEQLGCARGLSRGGEGAQFRPLLRHGLADERAVQHSAERVHILLTRHHRPVRHLGRGVARHLQRVWRFLADVDRGAHVGQADRLAEENIRRREADERPAGLLQTPQHLSQLQHKRGSLLRAQPVLQRLLQCAALQPLDSKVATALLFPGGEELRQHRVPYLGEDLCLGAQRRVVRGRFHQLDWHGRPILTQPGGEVVVHAPAYGEQLLNAQPFLWTSHGTVRQRFQ